MCGICALIALDSRKKISDETKEEFKRCCKSLRHRGPDWSGIEEIPLALVGHERLAINGLSSGAQPIYYSESFKNGDGFYDPSISYKFILSVNGEIYNHKQLETLTQSEFKTDSDCEVILHLIKDHIKEYFQTYDSTKLKKSVGEIINALDGVFSFVLIYKYYSYCMGNSRSNIDSETRDHTGYIIARDRIGVNPLYYGITQANELMVASEMKALAKCVSVLNFPPGCFMIDDITWSTKISEPIRYCHNGVFGKMHSHSFDLLPYSPEEKLCRAIELTLVEAVRKRLMSEVPFGIFLSGGLDSSIIASIACRIIKEKVQQQSTDWVPAQIDTLSIGLADSPDLIAAQKVGSYLGTRHHTMNFTVEEGWNAIEDVIYHLETFDVTTIRASTPMYLLARKCKAMGLKMMLSGEGSDEIFGGYLYFHNAPTPSEFQQECYDRTRNLDSADCLRANKSTMAWGLEVRVPFLDYDFLEVAMPINPNQKLHKIEKYILRKSFENNYLPDEVLWRQKEQFSDGVGYGWINHLKTKTAELVSDGEMANASYIYPEQTPDTKEAFYYRKIFEKLFPGRQNTVKKWIPKSSWGVPSDPSGLVQQVHESQVHVQNT